MVTTLRCSWTVGLWVVVILTFLLMGSSMGRSANSSPEKTGETIAVEETLSRPIGQEGKDEILNDLHWINATIAVLQETVSAIRNASSGLKILEETNQSFRGELGCQIPYLEGKTAHIGKRIVQHFITATSKINAAADTEELENVVTKVDCLLGVFKEISEDASQGKFSISRKEHSNLNDLISMAEVQIDALLEQLYQRQHILTGTFNLLNDVLLGNDEKQYKVVRRLGSGRTVTETTGSSSTVTDTTTPENMHYDNMILAEIQNIIASESDDLHITLHKISLLVKELSAVNDAVAISEDFQDRLEDLEKIISSSNISTEDLGIVIISHGPYCDGLFKTGTMLKLLIEMLEEAVNATLALKEASGIKATQTATNKLSCHAGAVTTVLRISSGRFSATEISKVSVALNATRLKVEETQPYLREYSLKIANRLEALTLHKERLQSRLDEIKNAYRNLIMSHSTGQQQTNTAGMSLHLKAEQQIAF